MRDRDDRAPVAARRPATAPGGGPPAGRSARSPRRAPACAGRPAPAGPARSAAPAAGSAPGRRSRRPCPARRAAPRPTRGRRPRRAPSSSSSSSATVVDGEREVLPQGADEDVVLLGDQRDVAAQVGQRQLGQPDAADRHRAGARRVDARPAAGPASTCRRRTARPWRCRSPTSTDRSTPCSTSRPVDVGEPHVLGLDPLALGHAPVTSRSSGTCATPSSRASEAAPTWSSSRMHDDPVDRVDQHLHVERRGGDVAERHRALGVEPAAEQQGRDGRDQVGDLDGREEHRAQEQRVLLRGVRPRDVLVDPRRPARRRARAPRPCARPRPSR